MKRGRGRELEKSWRAVRTRRRGEHHGNHEDDAYAGIQGDEEVTDKQRFVVTSPLTYLLVH